MRSLAAIAVILVAAGSAANGADKQGPRARVVSFHGYDDCIRLENKQTRVTLCPAAGGRILEYAFLGKNALALPAKNDGSASAGRFDIGPEQTIPKHPRLWMGRWTGKITGPRSARLTSVKDKPTGVQLIRDFTLAESGTKLECRQTIVNVSKKTVEYCHWSRTFAPGGGIVVIPLTANSRFPNGYVMYEPKSVINFRPRDPNIRKRGGFLEITGAPKYPKLGMDTYAGWFAYLMKNDLLFVKRFPTYPKRVYNEVAGLTMSIWYPSNRPVCELEPIGPRERLEPGRSASFTETWWLLPQKFPKAGTSLDLKKLAAEVNRATAPPKPARKSDLQLSYQDFDQKPGQGWRRLADGKKFLEAAQLIDRYAKQKSGLAEWQQINLRFHAGQLYAFAGKERLALERFKKSLYAKLPANSPVRWNAYVRATIAFLEKDRDTLKKQREIIARGPKFRGSIPNLDVVDRLLKNFGQPYRTAYRAGRKKPQ